MEGLDGKDGKPGSRVRKKKHIHSWTQGNTGINRAIFSFFGFISKFFIDLSSDT